MISQLEGYQGDPNQKPITKQETHQIERGLLAENKGSPCPRHLSEVKSIFNPSLHGIG